MLFRHLVFCFALFGWLAGLSASLQAQDDNPFGGGSDPFSTGTDPFGSSSDPAMGTEAVAGFGGFDAPAGNVALGNVAEAVGAAEKETDPAVISLRESPPETPKQMANGITWMVRLKRYDEIARLLDSLKSKNWNLQQKAELARTAGSAIWIRMLASGNVLSDEHRALVSELLRAPGQIARNPQWIDQWIDRLGSESAGERRLAQLKLQDGSAAAIERLVSRLLDGEEKVAPAMLAATVTVFGEDGVDALRCACVVKDPVRASRAFQALAALPGNDFSAEIGAGLVSRVLPVDAQAALANSVLQKYGSIPTAEAIHDFLEKQFATALAGYQTARMSSGLSNLVWRLSPDGNSVQRVSAPAEQRELERLTQLAVLRLQQQSVTAGDRIEAVTTLLQRAYKLDPRVDMAEVEPQLLLQLDQSQLSDSEWPQLFEKASEWQMHGAALRAVQMMAGEASQVAPPVNFLSELLYDSRPIVRYAAIASLAKLDPQENYRGAERAIEVALEMSQLGDGPHALVIGLQSDLRQATQQQLLQELGSESTSANSAQAALLALDRDEPIELIFVVDRVSDMSLFEMLQRLRNSKKGHALPIAVLTEELYSHERRLISRTPGVVASVLSTAAGQMGRTISQLYSTVDTQPMSPEERANFSAVARDFLTRIASNRDLYSFYPIGDWREHLVSVADGLPATARTQLLSGLGSGDSLNRLLQQAADAGNSKEERMAAVRAFGGSVKRYGMTLSREDVLQAYALYNRLGPNDSVAADCIGLILDVIEAQAGQKEWPVALGR